MQCPEVSKFVYVYLDGEFEPRERAEFEQHVNSCDQCREMLRFERDFHKLLRKRIERPEAPEGLRHRVLAALDEEDATQGARSRIASLSQAWKWVPLAAAAALVAVLAWPSAPQLPTDEAGSTVAASDSTTQPATPAAPLEGLVEDAVAEHEMDRALEVDGGADNVRRFVTQNAKFSARPPFPESATTRLLGARVARVGSRPAILYTYEHEGKRISVVQYAEPTQKGSAGIFKDRKGKHNVALFRDHEHGLANSVVGDVDEESLFRLIPASYRK